MTVTVINENPCYVTSKYLLLKNKIGFKFNQFIVFHLSLRSKYAESVLVLNLLYVDRVNKQVERTECWTFSIVVCDIVFDVDSGQPYFLSSSSDS